MVKVNPKDYGYVHMQLSKELREALDEIKQKEFCKSRAEALRRVIAFYRKSSSEVKHFGSEKVYIFETPSFLNEVMGACYGEVFSASGENGGRFCVVAGIA